MLKLKQITGRISTILAATYFLSFACLLVYSIVDSSSILGSLKPGFIMQNSLYLFFKHLIVIHCTGVLLGYSLFLDISSLNPTGAGDISFHKLISKTLILFIVLTAVYTMMITVLNPLVYNSLYKTRFLSVSAKNYLKTAEAAKKEKNYQKAFENYEFYLAIDPNNSAISKAKNDLIENIIEKPLPGSEKKEETRQEPAGLLKKAEDYLDRQDYTSAYYYASLAAELDKNNKFAQDLANEAWEKMKEYGSSKQDEILQKLYQEKDRGYEALRNNNYLEAYYIFSTLKKDYPYEAEIPQYLSQSEAGLKTRAFFRDEILASLKHPGIADIAFINPDAGDSIEMIYLEKMIHTGTGIYMYNIVIMDIATAGGFRQNQYTYGKLLNDRIIFNVLPREVTYADLINFRNIEEKKININPEHLTYFSLNWQDKIKSMGIGELLQAREDYGKAGFDGIFLDMEILLRLLFPCLFFILSLLSVSFGWTYRKRYIASPPLITFLLIPVLPFVLAVFFDMILYFHKIILGFVLLSRGFFLSLAALVVMEFIILIVSLLILAGRSTD